VRAVNLNAPPIRFVEREATIQRRLWRGNAFSMFVGPALYLLAMGVGLGGMISSAGHTVDGLSYLEFVAPGLMAATVLQNATGESMWPVLAGFKWMRFYEGMAASPMTPADVYRGNLLWIVLRFTVAATAFLIVATLLGAILSPWAVLAIPAAVFGALALTAPLTAYVATQEDDHKFPLIMRFLTLPMFLFSATFFPLSQLPALLQPVAWILPLYHSVSLCRDATTGTLAAGGWWAVAGHLAILSAYVAVGYRWGTRTFTRRLAA
jgi:lipooligosaccharide transport system permease protein